MDTFSRLDRISKNLDGVKQGLNELKALILESKDIYNIDNYMKDLDGKKANKEDSAND